MRKEELIKLAKELNELDSVKGREDDLSFIKREFIRLNNREEETFFEKNLTNEFNKVYDELAKKYPELNKSSLEDKKDLISKAKARLMDENNIKSLTRDIESLFNEFKHLPKCSKEQDDEMFEEFRKIKEEASKKVDAYYSNIKASFEEKKAKKEAIIKEAKELLNASNMKDAILRMYKLMDEWKEVGFAGKECDEELWNEFSSVRKEFSVKKKEHYEHMKVVVEERAVKKAELIKKVKYITSEAYFTPEEIKEIKGIEREFRNLGFAGKEKDQELWDEMQAAVKKYFEEMKFYK